MADIFVEAVKGEIAILLKEAEKHEYDLGMGGHACCVDYSRRNQITGLKKALCIYNNTRK